MKKTAWIGLVLSFVVMLAAGCATSGKVSSAPNEYEKVPGEPNLYKKVSSTPNMFNRVSSTPNNDIYPYVDSEKWYG